VEWKFDRKNPGKQYFTLQENISLIQVASESEVGLFHIGLHEGNTVAAVLAPSLRKLIETESITKTGVAILNADAARLKKYMNLRPKGLFELSHLYRLVKYSTTNPAKCTRSTVSLAKQVEEHLGFPLSKGDVRTSDWSKALNQDQIMYAASDAYCGFILYHVMDAKRLKLVPTPPRPEHAEKWAPIRLAEPVVADDEVEVPELAEADSLDTEGRGGSMKPTTPKTAKPASSRKPATEIEELDALGKTVFDALCENRKELAARDGLKSYLIATNTVLANVAKERPVSLEDLAKVKGVGSQKLKNYGDGWLRVISTHVNISQPTTSVTPRNDSFISTADVPAGLPTKRKRPQFKMPPPLPDASSLTLPEDSLRNQQTDLHATLQRSVSAPEPSSSPSAFEPLCTPSNQPESADSSPQVDPSFRRLYSALSALRIRLSGSMGKALHDVSSDETLKALAIRRPSTIGEICKIPFAGRLLQTSRSNDIDLLAFLQSQYDAESSGLNSQTPTAPTTVHRVDMSLSRSATSLNALPTIQNPSTYTADSNMSLLPHAAVARSPSECRGSLPIIIEAGLNEAMETNPFPTAQAGTKEPLVEDLFATNPVDDDLDSYFDEEIDWAEIDDGI
jgi:ribonuclease D